jgi:ribonuclease R
MLPEKLSNGLCSLRPNEDKLCFSAIFELDEEAQVVSEWFGRTAIHSDRRFSYEEAQEILDGAEGDFKDEILSLNVLAHKLRKKRFAEGSISFETPEVKFKLDEEGTPIGLVTKVRQDAHKLIEDFMLLANKKVAEFVFKKKEGKLSKTFIYRVHENPNTEKLDNFINFAKRFGHDVNFEGSVSTGLNKLTAEIEGQPEESVLQSLAIRAMAKARYTTETLGHFGLGFNHYSHFTSPIRRYPDMMVHRLLQRYLDKGNAVDQADYEEKCEHTSEREGIASQAERESIKYKQVEYMSKAESKVYDGVISGVTDFGLFVELIETKCEGMIRVSSLEDDYYEYDASKYQITGRSNKKVFAFGDKVTVRVVRTDLRSRTIDLDLIDKV